MKNEKELRCAYEVLCRDCFIEPVCPKPCDVFQNKVLSYICDACEVHDECSYGLYYGQHCSKLKIFKD